MQQPYIYLLILVLSGCAVQPKPNIINQSPGAELSPQEFPTVVDLKLPNGRNYQKPKILSFRNPEYPIECKISGLKKAVVKVKFTVGVDGLAHEVHVLDAPHSCFETAVMAVTHDWRFESGLMDGRPVPVKLQTTVTFELI